MDIPVMTSASTHGLRSAVGVCAKPGSPYMNSSKYSGGCLEKIVSTVNKSHGSSILNELNFSKKRKSTNECIIVCKRNKSPNNRNCSNQCFTVKTRNGKIKNIQPSGFAEGVRKKYGKGSGLDSFSKSDISSEFLSKIKSKDFFDQTDAVNDSLFTGQGNGICRRVNGNENGYDTSITKSVTATSSCNPAVNLGDNNGDEVFNSDEKNNTTSISGESHNSDECVSSGLVNITDNEARESGNKLIWQPNHLVTRRSTQISRCETFLKKKSSALGSDCNGFKTEKQIFESIPAASVLLNLDIGTKLTRNPKIYVLEENIYEFVANPFKNIVHGLRCIETEFRKFAITFREVLRVWQARFGSSSYVSTGQVPLLLKDLQLVPPKSDVHKSLERTGRVISFEEFCRFLAESGCLKFCDTGLPRTVSEPRKFGKNGSHQQTRRGRKLSKAMCKYDVFLGGSCNPTTWRADIAIPDLKEMGITYFNPVSQWSPDLLEVEYHAKENAAVMFFVIDNQTRAISALIEVAHIAGSKRNLILVIQSYTREKHVISGEIVSQEECDDLRNGQEVLRDLVDSSGIPVFESIRTALKYTEKLLRGKLNADYSDKNESEGSRLQQQPKRIEPREAYDSLAISTNHHLSLNDVCLALRLLTEGKETPPVDVEKVARILGGLEVHKGISENSAEAKEETVDFEQFSLLVTALGYSRDDAESLQGSSLYLIPKSDGDQYVPHMRDVFLGGTLKDSSWKDEIAVPLLKKHGLSFFNPRVSEWSNRFLPIEAAAMKNSHILLFVITDSARSIAEMAVAGYYIGLGARMVLCIQHFPEEATVGLDKLTDNAIKDYNRGRMYLADIAKRNGVRVFSDISDAVKCAVELCKDRCQT